MYTYLTFIFLILVFSIYIPTLKKFRKRNKEIVDLIQTLIITAIGIFVGMQLSIWKVEQDEKERLTKQIDAVQYESKELLNNLQNFKIAISEIDIDSSQTYQKFIQDNHLPKSYLFSNLIDNELINKYCSKSFFRASPQVQRNFNALQHHSQSNMDFKNAYTIVYGYIHQIESLIDYLEIEKKYINNEIDNNRAKEKYNQLIILEMKKNKEIQNLINK